MKTKPVQERPQGGRDVSSAPKSTGSVETGLGFTFPQWPSSKPGPRVAPIPAGMTPVNRFRPEQMRELDHDRSADAVKDNSSVQAAGQALPKNKKRS